MEVRWLYRVLLVGEEVYVINLCDNVISSWLKVGGNVERNVRLSIFVENVRLVFNMFYVIVGIVLWFILGFFEVKGFL